MSVVEERPVSTAKELWDLLSPENNLIENVNNMLFRGQAKANWKLSPSIFRENNHPSGSCEGNSFGCDMDVLAEWQYLNTFLENCDAAGVYLPGDNYISRQKIRSELTPYLDGGSVNWPSENLYDFIAIAQHYGLPTRFLDWTRRSYVAAYFAASEALKYRSTEPLAIWCFNHIALRDFSEICVFPVPAGLNKNSAAQAGLFSLIKGENYRKPLNVYVEDKGISSCLIKLTLPVSEAPFLLGFCRMYGVTGATIYPDIYGAAKSTVDWSNALLASQR